MAGNLTWNRHACASLLFPTLLVTLAACQGAQSMPTQPTHVSTQPPPSNVEPRAQPQSTATPASNWTHTQWWESGLTTVVLLDTAGNAICNGAMVDQRHAISLVSCHGAALVHFRYDHSAAPVPARRTESGSIAIFEIDHDEDQVWPHKLPTSAPSADEDLRAMVFPYPDVTKIEVSAQACHLHSPSNAAPQTDCVNPSVLPGAPLFNWNGDLVGLISSAGHVVPAAEIRTELAAQGMHVE
jgi:hypothetical protein